MEFNVTAGTNSSSTLSLIIAMEITNLILVVIPSVLLSSLLLYCLYKLKKVFVVRSLSFLYGCIAVIGIIMPISYRTALDVPLACDVLYDLAETDLAEQTCSALRVISDMLFVVGQAMVCFCVGMIAAVQFLAVSAKLKFYLSLKKVAVTVISLLVVVLCVNAAFFSSIYEHTKKNQSFTAMQYIILAWMLVFFLIPLLATITFSIFTYLTVKRNVLEKERAVLHSLALVSAFNVTSFASIRLLAMLLYLISIVKGKHQPDYWLLANAAVITGNLAYPFSVLTAIVTNSKIRKMFCRANSDVNSSVTV